MDCVNVRAGKARNLAAYSTFSIVSKTLEPQNLLHRMGLVGGAQFTRYPPIDGGEPACKLSGNFSQPLVEQQDPWNLIYRQEIGLL